MPVRSRTHGKLPPVIEAMLQPEFYPHPVSMVELKQTHTSYVLLAGEFAYKVRKAVRFPFIDCSTVDRRRALCWRELELNRRLSPDTYLGVVAIGQKGNRITLKQGTEKDAGLMEFAVKMRRLSEDRRLDFLIRHDTATADNIADVARTIGTFHASASNTHSWACGAAASIWRMTIGNLIEIEQLAPSMTIRERIARIENYSRRYIAAHWGLLDRRADQGRVREGHGDLRADAVYFTRGGIRIIDCLEFDERLRYGDIANEVAFLAMDLERLGRPDLSGELLAHFVRDPELAVLMPFYKSYRATVRAKVELLRSRQEDCDAQEQEAASDSAINLLDLALRYAEGPKALLIVCGASGTGKSTLAAMLHEHLTLEVVSSDVVRKGLAGVEPSNSAAAPYKEGIYTTELTNRVYASLLAEAKRLLLMGRGVILDATFGELSQRRLAIEMARQAAVQLMFIECRADKEVIIQRLMERARDPQRISDATVETYLAQLKEFDALNEVPPEQYHVVNTFGDLRAEAMEIERRVYSMQSSAGSG